jgi:hypothetical protein
MNALLCHSRLLFAATVALTASMLVGGCGNDDRTSGTADVVDEALEPADIVAGDAQLDPAADVQPDIAADTVEVACIPYADECPEGEYCQYMDDALVCIPEGDVVPDPLRTNPECPTGVCGRGGICMLQRDPFGNEPSARLICYQPCDPRLEGAESDCRNGRHTCWPVAGPEGEPLSFGICEY